jgi:ATP adenylyltransferase
MNERERNTRQGCPFCGVEIEGRSIAQEGSVFAVRDKYPVTPLHTLVLPRRHVADYFDLLPEERADAEALLRRLRAAILEEDPSVTGFNVGVNCGGAAGQTILHVHIHLIPRRDGDVDNPTGGVRGVIPERMDYTAGTF